jgi:hypothetical protein
VQAAAAALVVARRIAILAEQVANRIGVVGEPRKIIVGGRQFLAPPAVSQLDFEQLAEGGRSSAVADAAEMVLDPRRLAVTPRALELLPERVDPSSFADR